MIQILFEVLWDFIKSIFVHEVNTGLPKMKNQPPCPPKIEFEELVRKEIRKAVEELNSEGIVCSFDESTLVIYAP